MSPDDVNSSTNEASPSLTGTAIRINNVTLNDYTGTIDGVTPTGLFFVSANQPFKGAPTVTPNPVHPGTSFTIEFDAGRSGANIVAVWFDSMCGGSANEFCSTNSTPPPGDLNFAYEVNLSLQANGNTAVEPVYLGQGSMSLDNNWWIGGSCISSTGLLTATIGGQTVKLTIECDSDNGFNFYAAPSSDPLT